MKIDPADIKKIISTSIRDVTGSSEQPEVHQSLEELLIFDRAAEHQLKQTLIRNTLNFLLSNAKFNLKGKKLQKINSRLDARLIIDRRQSLGSFTNLFARTVNRALAGDSTKEKDENR